MLGDMMDGRGEEDRHLSILEPGFAVAREFSHSEGATGHSLVVI